MTQKAIKQTFKGTLNFNHIDPHFARFAIDFEDVKKGQSGVYGRKEFTITPDMFPEDFELSLYDVTGTVEFVVEIKKKK
jgi:hypothetical protein